MEHTRIDSPTNQREEDDKPKRPPNGYNLFYKEFRQRRADSMQGVKMGGLIALTNSVAKAWKALDSPTRSRYNAQGKKYQDKYKRDMIVWLDKQRARHQNAINARQQATSRLNEHEIAEYIKSLRKSGVIRSWSSSKPLARQEADGTTDSVYKSCKDVDDASLDKATLCTDEASGDGSTSQEATYGSSEPANGCADLDLDHLMSHDIDWFESQANELLPLANGRLFSMAIPDEQKRILVSDHQDFRCVPSESV